MAREYPADWPVTDGLTDTLPKVYVHLIDAAWPPANDDAGTPQGWAEVTDWEIDWQLVAPLMPGQGVNSAARYAAAAASCTIEQPDGHLLAPWRAGAERTPDAGRADLIASHNGPLGSTAFVLGRFVLDPIKGRLAAPFVTLTLKQDLVRLNTPHGIPAGLAQTAPYSASLVLSDRAQAKGFTYEETAELDALVTSTYWPRKTTELEAWQDMVASNLGALYLAMDGETIKVLDADYLLGTGDVVDVLDVSDDVDDLAWAQDPNAAVDRIVVSYLPPIYDDDSDDGGGGGVTGLDGAEVWVAPKGTRISSNSSRQFTFDPGGAAQVGVDRSGTFPIWANSSKYGTNTWTSLTGYAEQNSSGSWTVTIYNDTAVGLYLVAPYNPGSAPSFPKGTRSWVPGVIDRADSQSMQILTWGLAEADSANTLTFDLGRNVQRKVDAQAILARIVTRVTTPSYVIEDIRVPLDFRRELADIYRLEQDGTAFNVRAIVTGIKLTGSDKEIVQTIGVAAVPLTIHDFNDAWAAAFPGGATVADFNNVWAGKTIADFNADPLRTAP